MTPARFLALAAAALPAAAAPLPYSQQAILSAELGRVDALALHDLDADARPEVVCVGLDPSGDGSATITILQAPGDGSLTPALTIPLTGLNLDDPVDVLRIADLNADGLPDLLIAASLGALAARQYVVFATGLLTFAPPILTPPGTALHHFTTGDYLGDGSTNLFALDTSAQPTAVELTWNGASAFTRTPRYTLDEAPATMLLADVVGNAAADLIYIADDPDHGFILQGLDSGAFFDTPPAQFPIAGPVLYAIDLNDDASTELITLSDAQVVIWDRHGALTSTIPVAEGQPLALTAGEFDADGPLDLALALADTPGQPRLYARTLQPTSTGPLTRIGATGGAGGIVALDVNNDARDDLVFAAASGGLGVVLTRPDQPLASLFGPRPFDIPQTQAVHAHPADLSGDGIDDIILSSRTQTGTTVLISDAQGGFERSISFPSPATNIFRAAHADLNADTIPDFVAISPLGHARVFHNLDPTGAFADPEVIPLGVTDTYALALADLESDGFPDIISASDTTDGLILVRNVAGEFQPPQTVALNHPAFATGAADLNNDLAIDLVAVSSTGQLSVLLNDGAGNLVHHSTAAAPVGFPWVIIADVNADGLPDIVCTHARTTDNLSVWLGDGTGALSAPLITTLPGFPIEVDAADCNADTIPDLVIPCRQPPPAGAQDILVLHGDGQGAFHIAQRLPRAFATGAAFGHFNADSRPDIVACAHEGGAELTIWDATAPPCPADFDANGATNLDDIQLFVDAFLAADLAADLDGNGSINLDDIEAFVASFLAGCP